MAVEGLEVAVVGGGLVGLGIARDLALRSVQVSLFETGGICSGASGRNHGLLHSGARYALTDTEAARECAAENEILRKVAAPYVEPCGGLFVSTSAEENAYLDKMSAALSVLKIPCAEAKRDDTWLTHWRRALTVNDAFVNPFGLAAAVAYQSLDCGVKFHLDRVVGVRDGRLRTANGDEFRAEIVVLACGWNDELLCQLVPDAPHLLPDKGTMVVTERRLHPMVVNRARPPGDGDIVIPNGHSSILGTTSSPGTYVTPTRAEVDTLVEEAAVLFPQVRDVRLLRAYAGVRPLLGGEAGGRGASRSHRIITGDGVVAALGGKLTTFRLMSEEAADRACEMLCNSEQCTTDVEPLPDLTGDTVEDECGCEGATARLPERLLPLLGPSPHRFAGAGFGPCQGLRCLSRGSNSRERWRGMAPLLHRGQFKQAYLLWARERAEGGR